MNAKSAAQHYKEQQILNATAAEGVVLLYDGAIRFLLKARQAIEEGNIQERYNNNQRAGDIITYLHDTLNMEVGGEVAERLARIYQHLLLRMVDIDFKNDIGIVDEVVEKMKTLRASWVKIAQGGAEEVAPVAEESATLASEVSPATQQTGTVG